MITSLRAARAIAATLVLVSSGAARAQLVEGRRSFDLAAFNAQLKGCVVDHTANHGEDRRIWSAVLGRRCDLYVYLPPGYHPANQYPVAFWLHGLLQDEKFARIVIATVDELMAAGEMPPVIFVCPDGTFRGEPYYLLGGSFFFNGVKGRYEDWVMTDVWNFVTCRYPIRPEREAHALVGGSMGGTAAFTLGIRHKDCIGVMAAFLPLLDLRYGDAQGNRQGEFDPACEGPRNPYRPFEVLARYKGFIPLRARRAWSPVFGRPASVNEHLPGANPTELLDRCEVQPGELRMFIGLAKSDEFNGDQQARSFLHRAAQRGITPTVLEVNGGHGRDTGDKMAGPLFKWLGQQLAPYAP